MLKLDIDSKDGLFDCLQRIQMWNETSYPLTFVKVVESNKGWHVYLKSDGFFTENMKPFIQALLGSDWKREMLNIGRVEKRVKKWNILFISNEHGKDYSGLYNELLDVKVL